MKGRALFSSDSDASDDDFPPRRATHRGPTRGAEALFADPLHSTSADPPSLAAASAPFEAGRETQSSNSAPVSDAPPQTSKVASTRHNLSQLFGSSSSSGPVRPPSAGTAEDTAASRGSLDAAMQATLGRSSLPSLNPAAPTASQGQPVGRAADALFAPRFTYEGPSSKSGSTNALPLSGGVAGAAGSGLTTATHAVVQAYRGELSCGTAMLALCVPSSAAAASTAPAPQPLPPSAAARERLLQQQPDGSASATPQGAAATPLLLLMSANRQVLCKVALDAPDVVFGGNGSLQLQQDSTRPQFLSFYCPPPHAPAGGSSGGGAAAANSASTGCWWTCMFPDRDNASEFLVAVYTVGQYAAALAKRAGQTSAAVPTVRVLPGTESSESDRRNGVKGDSSGRCVRMGVTSRVYWSTWALRRVSRTTPYCLPADRIDAVPPSSPREVVPGSGAAREGLEAALVGMRSGESRLVFLSAEETRVRHPELASPPQAHSSSSGRQRRKHDVAASQLDGPAVVYVTCAEAVIKSEKEMDEAAPEPPSRLSLTTQPQQEVAAAVPDASNTTPAATAAATSALLQHLLLQTLQQTAAPPPTNASSLPAAAASSQSALGEAVERSLDRVMLQLGSLYEKVDRLDIEGKLQRNNAELERVMKRVVGLAPQEDVAIEDTVKDRDALLASLERYRQRYEEANTNYQRALEAMGRSADKAQALERDLQVQQELWTRQRSDEAERTRLKAVERDVQHRQELERVSEERYAAGKSDGHAAGYREGRQAALTAVDGEGGVSAVMVEWKAKVTARDQQIVALQTALQDAKFHHERDRRQLRAEIDVLTELNEKLQHLQANADVRMPEETTQQQCKRVKRTLNTVYAEVEAQVLALPQHSSESRSSDGGGDLFVSAQDVLAVVMTVIRGEAQAAVAQIRSEAERRAAANAAVRALTTARHHTQRHTAVYPADTSADQNEPRDILRRGEESMVPPPLPPLPTAGTRDALAAVAASLLPAVADAMTTAFDTASVPAARGSGEEAAEDARASASGRSPEEQNADDGSAPDNASEASSPSSGRGGRMATQLPPSPPAAEEAAQSQTSSTSRLPPPPPPPPPRTSLDALFDELDRPSFNSADAADTADAAAGRLSGSESHAEDATSFPSAEATPSIPDWSGRRLFTTPPSFTKPEEERQ